MREELGGTCFSRVGQKPESDEGVTREEVGKSLLAEGTASAEALR